MQNTEATQAQVTPEDKTLGESLLSAVKDREQAFTTGWWKSAESAEKLYCADHSAETEDTPYNILYSNTEVLLPSLYSATPKPDIRPRYRDLQLKPLPQVVERFLTAASDPGHPGEDCFDSALNDAVLSSLIPGMGYVRIRDTLDKSFPITFESGHYKTLIWGKATRWARVPWIAFKHPMKKKQLGEKFDIGAEALEAGYQKSDDSEPADDCCVYEIWHKASRKVFFVSEEWSEKTIRVSPDPLELVNFYPTPGLLCLTAKPGKLAPIPLYVYYRQQAEELNRVSVRLNKVLSAIRVRGAYNSLLGTDLGKILAADATENELVAASEAALLAQSGGFDKHIWMLPIEKLITVAQELYRAREAIKTVIYELTGISDIIRGSSVASETATAQDLKAKWGTVRLRKMQKIVGDYARDLFRLTVDAATTVVPEQLWKDIVQMPLPTSEEKAVAQQQMQYLTQTAQMTGQPPDPKQVEPLQKTLSSPSMAEVIGKIREDATRTFVINIQTNSTIDLDSSQDKAEVGEFMNAMGQLLAGIQPLMALGPSGVEATKILLISVCQRFKFGMDAADAIQQIQPPQPEPAEAPKGPPPPTPEETAALKAELDYKMAKVAADMQILQAETALALAEIDAKKQRLAIDIEAAQLTLAAKRNRMPIEKASQNANV
jgi:hypothetical protein